jgi:hypothetical protein
MSGSNSRSRQIRAGHDHHEHQHHHDLTAAGACGVGRRAAVCTLGGFRRCSCDEDVGRQAILGVVVALAAECDMTSPPRVRRSTDRHGPARQVVIKIGELDAPREASRRPARVLDREHMELERLVRRACEKLHRRQLRRRQTFATQVIDGDIGPLEHIVQEADRACVRRTAAATRSTWSMTGSPKRSRWAPWPARAIRCATEGSKA